MLRLVKASTLTQLHDEQSRAALLKQELDQVREDLAREKDRALSNGIRLRELQRRSQAALATTGNDRWMSALTRQLNDLEEEFSLFDTDTVGGREGELCEREIRATRYARNEWSKHQQRIAAIIAELHEVFRLRLARELEQRFPGNEVSVCLHEDRPEQLGE